jgi:hypothetical protein
MRAVAITIFHFFDAWVDEVQTAAEATPGLVR